MTRLLRALLALSLFAVTAELSLRAMNPVPRVQAVYLSGDRPELPAVQVVDGQPMWRNDGSDAREQVACDRPLHVLLVGSSITFGVELEAPEALGARLQEVLDTMMPGRVCVHSVAQPGFVGANKLVAARAWVAQHPADLVLWELWSNEVDGYVVSGDYAWNFGPFLVDELGYPSMLVPASVNAALWQRSAAWRFLRGTVHVLGH